MYEYLKLIEQQKRLREKFKSGTQCQTDIEKYFENELYIENVLCYE